MKNWGSLVLQIKCLHPHKFKYGNQIPTVMVFEVGTLVGGWLEGEGIAFVNGINALMKEAPESSLASSTIWGLSQKMAIYEPGCGLS